ncbi:bone marrow stromal antigen 2 isoform X2 [Phyllostomus discolor]|uniref:Bone marrow stromal antigen 2 isoform X2 n=1 Tax=Phyllostomus discolor TaxID=89673 RepID=A0A7E6EAU5_9CHIR|nr:bone marrow stromal antigen 2 isoform X2 [Phyllostomus discolor]
MTSTFYHYIPLPMVENSRELMLGHYKLPRWLGILLVLLALFAVGLFVATIILSVQVHSPACKDGRRAEQECRNLTHFLERQWTQAQEILLKTKAQAATYNQTAVTLMASLKMQQAQGQKLQEQVQELQEEIRTLKQKLQDTTQKLQDTTQKLQDTTAELNELRKDHESFGRDYGSTNSGNTLSLSVVTILLTLSLLDLLA